MVVRQWIGSDNERVRRWTGERAYAPTHVHVHIGAGRPAEPARTTGECALARASFSAGIHVGS